MEIGRDATGFVKGECSGNHRFKRDHVTLFLLHGVGV
jgi:hypothetical protein